MYLQTSHCHLINNTNENFLVNEWEQLPYPLIQPENKLLYLEWSIIFDETKTQLGTVALKQLSNMITFEIIYDIDPEKLQLDLLEELLRLQIDYSFNVLKIQRVIIKVRAIKFDIISLLRRLGMTLEEKIMVHGIVLSVYVMMNQQQLPMIKMRSASLVHSQVLQFVKHEEAIRILIQTGLRLNRNAPIDLMRDYHYRLIVKVESFLEYANQTDWMNNFGEEVLIVKKLTISEHAYLFQIQFQDGVRLDLEFISLDNLWGSLYEETLCRTILDKDDLLPPLDEPNDSAHYLQLPTEDDFRQLLTDISWSQIEVAKAMYRDELPLIQSCYGALLQQITTLLSWKIGIKYNWKLDLGRGKRWLKRYLPEHMYSDYLHLYMNKGCSEIWDRLFFMGPFIQKVATEVSQCLGYYYDQSQSDDVTKFLHRINSLPDNATDFN